MDHISNLFSVASLIAAPMIPNNLNRNDPMYKNAKIVGSQANKENRASSPPSPLCPCWSYIKIFVPLGHTKKCVYLQLKLRRGIGLKTLYYA